MKTGNSHHFWSCNVTTSTRESTTRAWISANIWRQDGAICSKNRKIVPYHGSARIPRLTVSVPDYGSWSNLIPTSAFLWEFHGLSGWSYIPRITGSTSYRQKNKRQGWVVFRINFLILGLFKPPSCLIAKVDCWQAFLKLSLEIPAMLCRKPNVACSSLSHAKECIFK